MKRFNIIAALILAMGTSVASAQASLLNAKTASEIGEKTLEEIVLDTEGPRAYAHINERDILWQKKVWEVIPADQKANMMYFLPLDKTHGRKPLFDILMDGVMSGAITEVYDDDTFTHKLNLQELKSKLSRTVITDEGIDQMNLGLPVSEEYIDVYKLRARDVKEYKIMGLWYFDRNEGELKYRLLGICPVTVDLATRGLEQENLQDLFWIFFPGARDILYKHYAYNEKNQRSKVSFDQLFNMRKFNATIYKADNAYGDYAISDLIQDNAMRQLIEADRIKEEIREFEDDLWNY